ncbi:hypothetical protein ABFG93_07780 [Pseudalkalibacillus hwajinpoensis]|uniref:hypothetical protein n=1 Tax=Guptibacillus hwajinpoensis TaxID=208199 RepID=UPI00325B8B10
MAFIGTVPNIWIMILSQFVIKMGLAILDTPILYLLTKVSSSDPKHINTKNPLDA